MTTNIRPKRIAPTAAIVVKNGKKSPVTIWPSPPPLSRYPPAVLELTGPQSRPSRLQRKGVNRRHVASVFSVQDFNPVMPVLFSNKHDIDEGPRQTAGWLGCRRTALGDA
jgi:hypothetical protein